MRRLLALIALLASVILLGGCSWSSYHLGFGTGYGSGYDDYGYEPYDGHYGYSRSSFRYHSYGGRHIHHSRHHGHGGYCEY